jgi:asparagine synthase (glutamine-hydrolysing)
MCGILGAFTSAAALPDERAVHAALAAIGHRGPDAQGLFRDRRHGVVLGHVRLSIIDLDARADQPFAGDRCRIAFNGEIYNFGALRDELVAAGACFRTGSDTEVIVHGYRRWGCAVFDRLQGMFAIALFDEVDGRLHLVRDPFGIKPLLVLQRGDDVWFGSEVKAIAAFTSLGIDAATLCDVLRWGFPLEDRSLYAGVEFLPAGARRSYARAPDGRLVVEEAALWRPLLAAVAGAAAPTPRQLADVLDLAVADHMIADVPVAVALSGGLDSSLVAAFAARRAERLHAHTFTMSDGTDAEVEHAMLVAKHLGLRHHVARLRGSDVGAWLRAVAWHLEEPIVNLNALPGFALAAAARAHGCKVVLVGEGADELFGGYPWYRFALEPALAADPGALFDAYARRRTQPALESCLLPATLVMAAERFARARRAFARRIEVVGRGALDGFLAFDLDTQLEYGQLLRVDRMFMAHGVEARVPFLYPSVARAAAALRPEQKILTADGPGRREKVALGEVARSFLPPEVASRPKFGPRGTVDLWGSWLEAGLVQAYERALASRELTLARDVLSEHLDWRRVREAQLRPKDRFAVALLLEAVDAVLARRSRPEVALPMQLEEVG